MSKIHTYPKIFPVGSDFIPDLFKGHVFIEEKVDGSQFGFGMTADGTLVARSKGKELQVDNPERMFEAAVKYAESVEDKLKELLAENPAGVFIYGEFLGSPSHNILKYSRVPKNNIVVFGVMLGESFVKEREILEQIAEKLGLEAVPLLYHGEIKSYEELSQYLNADSLLGSEKVEGVVVKNYLSPAFLGNMVIPSMGKYVREDFKERHAKDWGPKFSGASKMEAFVSSFRGDEARFLKAIQHLKDNGELTNSPKDIGNLLKELEKDFVEEEKEAVKEKLWQLNHEKLLRVVRAGFPEFYKQYLAKKAFNIDE